MKLNYGPRMERFAMRPPEEDARINLLVGSVRSGKTWGLHSKILYLCDYQVAGRKILTGSSKASIKTNVLTDLFDLIGDGNYDYNNNSGELRLFDSEWLVIGAKDEGSERYIRGSTVGAAVCDEIVLMPQGFWQMLLSRMSPPGARVYGSTNPAGPYHWLKRDTLDRKSLVADPKRLWWATFTMDDNPNLTEDYIADQKLLYTGVFYKRFIEGQWVMSEGAIYLGSWDSDVVEYDDDAPATLYNAGGHVAHTVVIDYGTNNPCVFLDCLDDGRKLWFDDEYYYDSRETLRERTDGEHADALDNFVANSRSYIKKPKILLDPSAASFEAELMKRNYWVVPADNEVLDGIRRVSAALKLGLIRINSKRCRNTVREMQAYAWNEKKAMKTGEEEPIKTNDHTCDAVRYKANEVFVQPWRLNVAA